MLCVRLVFCLYAEDSGLFGGSSHSAFHDYLVRFKPGSGDMRRALIDLFDILNTPIAERDPYLDDALLAFPYVNGGLFADRGIEIPRLNDEIATLLLKHASDDFDWSQISPTIFGAVFESTLNPQTRRSGGMHYTSIENIHKVIDPLFLDALKEELQEIRAIAQPKDKMRKAKAFQEKLASLKFLDPACGSGNFLTETFLSLRRLENEAIRILSQDNMIIGFEDDNSWIRVGIHQFYGIEINDFAVATATTALWIAEAQMMRETENIIHQDMDFFPLKSYTNIVEGNALRMDWNEVVPAEDLSYIMGNPPFVGGMIQSKEQKQDMISVFGNKLKGLGELDYVAAWYRVTANLMNENPALSAAFVSTNSISQGEQVSILWEPLSKDGIIINFAHQTFVWDSESNSKAHVHVVIVGFSKKDSKDKVIYTSTGPCDASHINGYLTDAPDIFIHNVSAPICEVPPIAFGNMPRDGGGFILTEEEKNALEMNEPISQQWIHPYVGAEEFIKGKKRYCLWLQGANPSEMRKCPTVINRIEKVREMRLSSSAESTRRMASTPTLFAQITQKIGRPFIIVPSVSSERRRYVPIGFMPAEVIASNLVFVISDANIFHFGILTSEVHMSWMRAVCGRLKSDYRYSKDIVYNNFPWPAPTEAQKAKVEKTAQAILDARNLYSDCSLADLYDELAMPVELRRAHQDNDKAVMEAYGFNPRMAEAEIVAALFKLYQELTQK